MLFADFMSDIGFCLMFFIGMIALLVWGVVQLAKGAAEVASKVEIPEEVKEACVETACESLWDYFFGK